MNTAVTTLEKSKHHEIGTKKMGIKRLAMESKWDETCDNNCGDTSIVPREQEAIVRRTIASMVRRTIANVVKQEQEAHNNFLGKLEGSESRKTK